MKRFQFFFSFLLSWSVLNFEALAVDVLTNRGDNGRTGLNSAETLLTPGSVASPAFGLVYNNPVDGQVYAQPLYVSHQQITPTGGQPKVVNVLYVATEHDSLYAFDADTGVQYWKTSLIPTGESPVQASDPNINCADIAPEIGITATPVIDRTTGPNGTIFVIATTTDGTNYFHRLHAVDLSTGQDRSGLGPVIIAASVPPVSRPANTFLPKKERSQAGLLLLNGIIYTSWSSYCDNAPFTGWIIAYNESDLSQAAVLNTDPNGSPVSAPLPDGSGNAIWQTGNGPAVDANGNIYVSTSNGPFDTSLTGGFPSNSDFGDSVLKISTSSGLSVTDYFTPFNEFTEVTDRIDIGSGGPVVLPDIVDRNGTPHHLLLAAGKDYNLYLLDRDNLGKFNPNNNNQIYQQLTVLPNGVWSSPAYFKDASGNVSVYYGGHGDEPIWQFKFDFSNPTKPVLVGTPASVTAAHFNFPGPTPTISASGTSNGILWAFENDPRNPTHAILHACDATNLGVEFYNSSNVNIGTAVRFGVPTVCNGKVFVGTTNSIAAFGVSISQGSNVAKDFNNDGFADLLWENTATGQHAIWTLNQGVWNSVINLPTAPPQWHIVGAADFLGNGQSDLVWENTATGERAIWILNSGVWNFSINLPTEPTTWHIAGAGDFMGTGQAGLVWENTVTGEHAIWILQNGFFTQSISLPTTPTNWRIAGVGDFDGDGQADLVWENVSTGERVIWILKNGVFTQSISLPTQPTNWHIAGAADFMGTGQAGLVWENTSTGQRAIWILQNGVFTQSIPLPTQPTNWHIVDH